MNIEREDKETCREHYRRIMELRNELTRYISNKLKPLAASEYNALRHIEKRKEAVAKAKAVLEKAALEEAEEAAEAAK